MLETCPGSLGQPGERSHEETFLPSARCPVCGRFVEIHPIELVEGRRFPSFEHVEHETLSWIGFYNDERLHEELGDVPPAEYEAEHYRLNIKTDNNRILETTKPSL